jgi:hypothetical protein
VLDPVHPGRDRVDDGAERVRVGGDRKAVAADPALLAGRRRTRASLAADRRTGGGTWPESRRSSGVSSGGDAPEQGFALFEAVTGFFVDLAAVTGLALVLHVQHVLAKPGFSGRSQIAARVARRGCP